MSSAQNKLKTEVATDFQDRVAECLERALALSKEARAEYFEALGHEDARLSEEVKSLAESHERSGTFLANPVGPKLLERIALDEGGLPEFSTGDVVGDFEIVRSLGRGGIAHVYLARQISLGREVALKVSRNSGREARLMAPLEHDHIVKVFSDTVDSARNLRFMCMQYIPGATLETILTKLRAFPKSKLSGAAVLEILDGQILDQVPFHPSSLQFREMLAKLDYFEMVMWTGARLADTLQYAHQQGVLHLDVKPANILLNLYGRFLLSDFNVSLSLEDVAGTSGQIGGTKAYMAPEQEAMFVAEDRAAAIKKLDRRADVYSLAIVLKEWLALAGDPPCRDEAPWKTVLDKALEKDPEKRFADAGAFAKALKGALERYRIDKELPPRNWFAAVCFRSPLTGLVLYGLVPQIMASAVNILYNQLEIVSRLSSVQQAYFKSLMVVYNPVVYAVCLGIWVWALRGILPYVKRTDLSLEKQALLRKRVLRLPAVVALVTTIGWVPSSVLFPLFIHLNSGALAVPVFAHFMVSFLFAWLVALGYSSLFIQFICVRVLYPMLWKQESDVQAQARIEMGMVAQTTRLYNRLTSYVPLLGALLLHLFAHWMDDYSGAKVLSTLTCLLITFGLIGNYLGSRRNNQLIQTLFAFMGRAALAERRSNPRGSR